VLYVSHTGALGGAEWSLLELVQGMRSRVDVAVACPPGELADSVCDLNVPRFTIRPVPLGFRLSTRATARGLVRAIGATFDIGRAARHFRADVVHANSVRAGIVAIAARAVGAPPPLVHVRDALPATLAGRLSAGFVKHGARLIVANSRFTASRLSGNGSGAIRVVYNGVDVNRLQTFPTDRAVVRNKLGFTAESPLLGVVAQLTPWKAQDDAIRVLALVREQRPDTQLALVGEAKFRDAATSYDNVSYETSLHRLADSLGVDDAVSFLGERRDVPDVLRALDILLVPSWHEPFGRSVIEAMAVGTPVIATNVGGPNEVLVNRMTGLLLPPRHPRAWAEAVLELLEDPSDRTRIAENAAEAVRARFDRDQQIEEIAEVYHELCSGFGARNGP
jgi:glycosyltransferase involved in cell wall biosynthesis